MTRLFLSIISLSLLIYTPYAFGEMSLSFLRCTSTYTGLKQNKETRTLLSDKLWKSYVSHKQTFSYYGQKNSALFISNKKETSSTIKGIKINTSNSIKKQELSKDINMKKETKLKLNVQLEKPKEHSSQIPINSTQKESTALTRKPSILEPIISIKPSLI